MKWGELRSLGRRCYGNAIEVGRVLLAIMSCPPRPHVPTSRSPSFYDGLRLVGCSLNPVVSLD